MRPDQMPRQPQDDDAAPPFTASVYGPPLAAAEAEVAHLRNRLAELEIKNAGQRAEIDSLNASIKEWMGLDYKSRVRIEGLVRTIDAYMQAVDESSAYTIAGHVTIKRRVAEILAANA